MSNESWCDIVQYLIPHYNKKTTPSKISRMNKGLEKLPTFEEEYSSQCEDLMAIQFRNFNAKPPALSTCSATELSNLDFEIYKNYKC